MLSLLLFLTTRKKESTLEDQVADIQKGNETLLNTVLDSYKPFVKKSVSSVCKRYIHESDDEFSIGLIAFHEAIMKYESKRGASLLSFADVIIKRKVIDYIRANVKHRNLQYNILGNDDETSSHLENAISLEEFDKQMEVIDRQEEILVFQSILKDYGLSFQDLVEQSPKHEDARINAIDVAKIVFETPDFLEYLQKKKKLPMKKLEQKVKVSRKTLERNRKYIIAIVLIMNENFVFLKDYLKGRLEP